MITKEDISAIVRGIAPTLKEFVTAAIDERFKEFDARLKALPVPKDGQPGPQGEPGPKGEDAPPLDTQAIIEGLRSYIDAPLREAIAAIPIPKDGQPGPQGEPGPKGEDAPPLDTQAIIEELRSYIDAPLREAIAAIPIPKDGVDGKDGVGIKGEKGERGQDAPPVDVDAIIETLRVRIDGQLREAIAELPKPQDGRDGRDGRDGIAKDGRDGKNGDAGVPGRDALEIEILSAIPEKSVPRGTFAQHKGGLWRAKRNTETMEDWDCVVQGFDCVEIEQIDLRTFAVIPVLSTGPALPKTFSVPTLIYREVYKDGVDYERGDVTTWGGNLWVCIAKTTKTKPGTSEDWRLAVRAGRDGKDLRNIKEPEPMQPVRLR